jgi:hypothetical protein
MKDNKSDQLYFINFLKTFFFMKQSVKKTKEHVIEWESYLQNIHLAKTYSQNVERMLKN